MFNPKYFVILLAKQRNTFGLMLKGLAHIVSITFCFNTVL